jgi:histidine kinase
MFNFIEYIRHRLSLKLIISLSIILLFIIATWAYFSIRYQREKLMKDIVGETERLSNTIKLGTHYAMMLNSRDEINQIIRNIATQKEIKNIRIYNKEGEIKFSNQPSEVDQITNIKSEACYICHRTDPPQVHIGLAERTRIFKRAQGQRLLGIISPIHNESGCSSNDCHFHPEDKQILGALDVVVSLQDTDEEIVFLQKGVTGLAIVIFLFTSAFIFLFVLRFVNRPIRRLIQGTQAIAKGDYSGRMEIEQQDEMGQLALAITKMGKDISEKQTELTKQRLKYQNLFDTVPCIITVQNRDYQLIGFNREFAETFDPRPGDYCFHAYKSRETKCPNCPVEKTFADGQSHYSEEAGVDKDGNPTYWIVKTSPIKNDQGEVIAAMEMNLDITHRKRLEDKLEQSEKKYHDIFNNIPNPTFVLDAGSLKILDCNDSIKAVYGYSRDDIINRSFMDFFLEEEKERYTAIIKSSTLLTRVRQLNRSGKHLFVNIRISPAEYPNRKVLLVTTSDITERLETEQQLIQASKMATLGEMATGVAHELNQPLAVIKTASSFFMKKVKKAEKIEDSILATLSKEIDSHVDRATKIINHMRQFGRKSDMEFEKVQVNTILRKAFEFFSQQLKVRGIAVVWELAPEPPMIMADADRLEQVFINLLINARDAIEEKWQAGAGPAEEKRIILRSRVQGQTLYVEVADTGTGIAKPIINKIFEPFFTTKEVGKGTGLGLSISYRIVQDIGGTIQALSDNGKGARFIIAFPIAR